MSFGDMKTTKVRVTAMIFAKLLTELLDGATAEELQESTGLAKSTIYDYLRELRKARLVYIDRFDLAANNCPMISVYKWGPGKRDAKVVPISEGERARRYRQSKDLKRLRMLGAQSEVSG